MVTTMPRVTKPLNATEVKNAKSKDKEYRLSDGQGLQLRVSPSGGKQWQLNYYRPGNGKRANFSLGRYPEVKLEQARKSALLARELITQGIDPQHDKEQKKQAHNAYFGASRPPISVLIDHQIRF